MNSTRNTSLSLLLIINILISSNTLLTQTLKQSAIKVSGREASTTLSMMSMAMMDSKIQPTTTTHTNVKTRLLTRTATPNLFLMKTVTCVLQLSSRTSAKSLNSLKKRRLTIGEVLNFLLLLLLWPLMSKTNPLSLRSLSKSISQITTIDNMVTD